MKASHLNEFIMHGTVGLEQARLQPGSGSSADENLRQTASPGLAAKRGGCYSAAVACCR